MNMSNRERIGKAIARIRKKRKLSQRELAEVCGVNYSNIGKIERGAYNVSIDILGKVCSALGAKIEIREAVVD